MKIRPLLLLSILALFTVSCSSSTPAKRIEENPKLYSSLSPRHQALIDSGKIENGMTTRAVYLAWGHPDSQAEGQEKGKTIEKWSYNGLAPVYHQSFYGGFGYGWGGHGRHGRHRGYYPYNGFGSSVSYVPYRAAWVKFLNGRVDSWQRGRIQ